MAAITHVNVSEKAGLAEIQPPIEVSWARGGTHEIGDCIYSLEQLAGRNDAGSDYVQTTQARITAETRNDDPNVSQQDARYSAEAIFRFYGRALVWQS